MCSCLLTRFKCSVSLVDCAHNRTCVTVNTLPGHLSVYLLSGLGSLLRLGGSWPIMDFSTTLGPLPMGPSDGREHYGGGPSPPTSDPHAYRQASLDFGPPWVPQRTLVWGYWGFWIGPLGLGPFPLTRLFRVFLFMFKSWNFKPSKGLCYCLRLVNGEFSCLFFPLA